MFGGKVHAHERQGDYLHLHMAATKGMAKSIEILAKYKADIHALYIFDNEMSQSGWTPFICACIANKKDAAIKLLELGANPLDTNDKGVSAIDICIKNKNVELVEYIKKMQNKD